MVERGAIEVADHQVDQYVITINASDEVRGQPGMAALQGDQNGAIFHVDDAVVVALNQDEAMLAKAVVAAGGKGTLDRNAGIAAVRRRLPRSCIGQCFVNIGPMLQTFARFNPMIASVANRAANVPPVAAAAGVYEGSIAVRGFVPMKLISTVKSAVMMQMAGGMGVRQAR